MVSLVKMSLPAPQANALAQHSMKTYPVLADSFSKRSSRVMCWVLFSGFFLFFVFWRLGFFYALHGVWEEIIAVNIYFFFFFFKEKHKKNVFYTGLAADPHKDDVVTE